ncbi:hypothetical protein DPMN_135354 [Dreissena polymorpha]|uniref:Uncharacterized protein n=1 Tax=Dreissena polymorpha TaxID=45954 RepID=A0A9D4JGR5_DREPO|nr:hypothetical protein DPMN_135354 [Dreissena polymorpha]
MRLLTKCRLIRRISQNTGKSRQRITLTSSCKVRRQRDIEQYRTSVMEFMSRDDNSRQNPGKKEKLKSQGKPIRQ